MKYKQGDIIHATLTRGIEDWPTDDAGFQTIDVAGTITYVKDETSTPYRLKTINWRESYKATYLNGIVWVCEEGSKLLTKEDNPEWFI